MRKRGRSPTECFQATNAVRDAADQAEMLDTDDQEAFIQSMEAESRRQSKFFQTAFLGVGVFAMVVSLFVYPLLCQDECSSRVLSCCAHAIASCGTHGFSIKISRSLNSLVDELGDSKPSDPMLPPRAVIESPIFLLWSVANLLPFVLWVVGVFDRDVEHFHIGLALGNLVTSMGALSLLWDTYTTRQAFADLHGAKYEHKSL
jgi:hypothetical protein